MKIVIPAVSSARLLENGALVLAAVRNAVAQNDQGRLRKLCFWFPFALRMREVHVLLYSLPRSKAEQIAGLSRGYGRPVEHVEQLRLIATIELLREKGLTVLEAAKRIASVRVCVTAKHLASLHAEFGKLARCREGYWIPASEVPCAPWNERADDLLSVYVLGQSHPGG